MPTLDDMYQAKDPSARNVFWFSSQSVILIRKTEQLFFKLVNDF